ncbi:MAG: tRNA 2-selenouridine(34) synthase MnmH [Dechloromonas sp.]|nr:tRNA 2-selenouridine(34) synthase MnmH [Thauera sp.]MBN8461365.1 tRNA 2-selenouridine(34) synthase MnmH [Dechloromonas sp.]
MRKGVATVAQLAEFDEIIDARTALEFAEDRLPGAINLPVLDNEQRAIVGTIYKQRSAFEARRLGGAMVAENIARHLQGPLKDKPKSWRPLIYCWRGGQRSGSFVTWLRMVGWDACQLEGGYKAFRHHVIAELERLSTALSFKVICGPTGSAKTRVLEALSKLGAQRLDLEDLAAHKGSVLGALPDRMQPAQKAFETAICMQLQRFDPQRPVFVEAESRKIGRVFVPEGLILAMRRSNCVAIDATREARLEFLVRDYAYLGDDLARLQRNIDHLADLHSRETIARWKELASANALPELYAEFIDRHYDPLYRRSQNGNYTGFAAAPRFATDDLSPSGVAALAGRILAAEGELTAHQGKATS